MSDAGRGIGAEQPFVSHLIELRDRLLRIVLAIVILFLGLFAFANDIYHYIATPLMELLPEGQSMVATGVISPFLTPFKLTLVLSFYIAIPYVLYQVWGFVAPGLYKHERRLVMPLAVSSTLLFYIGMAFAYYVVFPLIFAFLTTTAPEGVEVMPDMKDYLDFVLKLFFAFGIAFEVPIATILLCWMGTTTPDKLREKRAYVIVGAFVLGMLLTPPDMISQTLLAIPMWLLFEAGILFAPLFMSKEEEDDPDPETDPEIEKSAPASESAQDKSSHTDSESSPASAEKSAVDVGPTEEEMEAELDKIEAEEDAEEAREREERARKEAQKIADNVRLDHYEPPLSDRYGPLDEASEKLLDEELEMMDGGVDSDSSGSGGSEKS
ncbi:MAG: twin-arginine translocase subunit TatC [Gammaproteobacteria bacterium]|jgi:sec-independent protein translocase protein TatC|nr:twin-arginine translocase subunit TatC [Gammaproteobacteria bacterium]MBT3490250.1 twin-arginine translocase subunit TatC [Gammaproteobacteria bacterium]MBT3719843.1 twin-arginine translocase subunit TatC [Gammaproteobacteria bacterium]MBT3845691.1 twin-arginine translocase subunit TatC [Gammaproteobacteria bacterium]MBT3893130.1 twin-arginine translocase subunit TatC [Gammaproteobacteria bacterium]